MGKNLDKIQKGLFELFKEPKSEARYITDLKEIKQFPNEMVYYFDQRLKSLMARVIFDMSYFQHKEWFISALVPHIRHPLMQQNIMTQSKDLEIEMNLEDSPIGETVVGMNQI